MISKCWLWNHLPANKNPIEFATANLWVDVLDSSSLSESVWILTLRIERKEKSFTSFGSSAGAAIFVSVFSQNFTAKKVVEKKCGRKKSQQRWICFEKNQLIYFVYFKGGKIQICKSASFDFLNLILDRYFAIENTF